MNKILWVDDEIDLLKPHILFLEKRGYEVQTATNGYDALKMAGSQNFDLVILDEMMVGMDGLTALREIKKIDASLKALMVTKSEEEGIFLEAVGSMIDDYLTKPVSPLQLYLSIRKNLEKEDIVTEKLSKNYIKSYKSISSMLGRGPGWEDWITINEMLCGWGLKLDEIKDKNLTDTFGDLKDNANIVFGNFVQENYKKWLSADCERPVFSTDIYKNYIEAGLGREKQALIVIDCFPYDQMSIVEEILRDDFSIRKDSYFSILPTATQFARNALFSGLFPSEIEEQYPDIYADNLEDERSSNRYEKELMEKQISKTGFDLGKKLKYNKVYRMDEFSKIESGISDYKDSELAVIVVNMVDFLIHNSNKDELVTEMMFSESAYRATIKSWFMNSALLRIIRSLGDMGFKIIITTDHGAKLVNRFTKVSGDGNISSGLRMKYGKNLTSSNKKQTLFWQKPSEYKMPSVFKGMNIIMAKEDHCFLYEKGLNEFYKQVKNTYQHGGVSLEEMILPVLVMKKKS
jgi:CheY-like chemotaxis protein